MKSVVRGLAGQVEDEGRTRTGHVRPELYGFAGLALGLRRECLHPNLVLSERLCEDMIQIMKILFNKNSDDFHSKLQTNSGPPERAGNRIALKLLENNFLLASRCRSQ